MQRKKRISCLFVFPSIVTCCSPLNPICVCGDADAYGCGRSPPRAPGPQGFLLSPPGHRWLIQEVPRAWAREERSHLAPQKQPGNGSKSRILIAATPGRKINISPSSSLCLVCLLRVQLSEAFKRMLKSH